MDIAQRLVPGLAELMRLRSLSVTERAALSRAVCATREQTLIVNVPGSPTAAVQNLKAILGPLSHGLAIMEGIDSECGTRFVAQGRTSKIMKKQLLLSGLIFLSVASGFAQSSAGKKTELLISAAASLTDCINELKAIYMAKNPSIVINCNYGSSGRCSSRSSKERRSTSFSLLALNRCRQWWRRALWILPRSKLFSKTTLFSWCLTMQPTMHPKINLKIQLTMRPILRLRLQVLRTFASLRSPRSVWAIHNRVPAVSTRQQVFKTWDFLRCHFW